MAKVILKKPSDFFVEIQAGFLHYKEKTNKVMLQAAGGFITSASPGGIF